MGERFDCISAAVLLLLISTFSTTGQGVVSFDGRVYGGSGGGQDQVQGWEFVPRMDVTILQLGLYDGQLSGGFSEAHVVAIWDASAHLVLSSPIPLGESASLAGSFRYVNMPATLLKAGQTYIIGAFMPSPASDHTLLFTPADAQANGYLMDPRIQFAAYRAGPSPGAISFPTFRDTSFIGGFGPNFVIGVPEPSTLSLSLVAAFAFFANRESRGKGGGKDSSKLNEALAKAKSLLN